MQTLIDGSLQAVIGGRRQDLDVILSPVEPESVWGLSALGRWERPAGQYRELDFHCYGPRLERR